jgi:S-layer protein
MAYTAAQLISDFTAAADGIAPSAAEQVLLGAYASQDAAATLSDAATLHDALQAPWVQETTDVAVLSYQFFTGGAPTAAGLNFLVNSAGANPTDLNSAYYGTQTGPVVFNTENRYYNFAINLATGAGAGAAAFAANYSALTLNAFISSAFEQIIGSSNETPAAAAAALASIEASDSYFMQIAAQRAPGANQDLATKAIAAGYIMEEALKADVGTYAMADDQFNASLAAGNAIYGTNLLVAYGPGGAGYNTGVGTNPLAILDFTTIVGETLNGGAKNTDFVGLVGTNAGAGTTLSNVVDEAHGFAGFHNTLTIINTGGQAVIEPTTVNVQVLSVTDNSVDSHGHPTSQEYDLQFAGTAGSTTGDAITEIDSDGSTASTVNFFNIQNFVSTIGISNADISTPGHGTTNFNFEPIASVTPGALTLNLTNAGNFDLTYLATGDVNVITSLLINNVGGDSSQSPYIYASPAYNDQVVNFDGLDICTTITVNDTSSHDSLLLVLGGNTDTSSTTSALTLIDASHDKGFFGAYGVVNENSVFTYKEADNGNFLNISNADEASTINVTADHNVSGSDTIHVHSFSWADHNTINISTGSGAASIDLDGGSADNQTINVTVANKSNNVSIDTASTSTVTVLAGSAAGTGSSTIDIYGGTADHVSVTALSGGVNDVYVNTVDENADSSDHNPLQYTGDNSVVTVALGNGGTSGVGGTAEDVGVTVGNTSQVTITAGNGANDVSVSEGSDGAVKITLGNGANSVTASVGHTATVNIVAGNGVNDIIVYATAAGAHGTTDTVNVTVGNGGNTVSVFGALGNNVNVQAGSGNDLIQTDSLDLTFTANGGGGTNTLETTASSADVTNETSLSITNFQILEISTTLVSGPGGQIDLEHAGFNNNTFQQIILNGDESYTSGTSLISSIHPTATVTINDEPEGGDSVLQLTVNNDAIDHTLSLTIQMHEMADGSGNPLTWGTIDLNNGAVNASIGTLNLDSNSVDSFGPPVTYATNDLVLVDAGIKTLNLTGHSNLVLDGSSLGDLALFPSGSVSGLVTLNGQSGSTFTGGLTDSTPLPTSVTTVNLASSGSDSLTLSDVGGQHVTVTLGNGTNVLTTGGGADTVTVGTGANTLDIGGAGTTINLGVRSHANADDINFLALPGGESTFTTADNVNGFNLLLDQANFSAVLTGGGVAFSFATDYHNTNSDANVAGLFAAAPANHYTVVYDTVSGNLYVDADHNGLLTTADFEVHFTGIPGTGFTATNLVV